MSFLPDVSPEAALRGLPADLAAAWARAAAPGHFDERRGPTTEAWRQLLATLGPQPLAVLEQHRHTLSERVRANGITYTIYTAPGGPQRPWSVDLFPLLVEPAAWRAIETGVQQRMRVLEAIMADIYGPQRLVAENLLPPALVHGHPGFLRGLRGLSPVGGRYLHIVAFDLARDAQGAWWVVSQRTQAPSGLGYLLENRSLISDLFPTACEQLRVRALADNYRALIESLRQRAPACEGTPHIALLTPGPYNETYFEQAYLARSLGLTLVEGADLTVRDERLYLKTVAGLQPVHVLIKRLDDEFLDPLELRADSQLGVPGLLQAVRAGQVLLANVPGSAVLESPALLGFLPALAEALLGESLSLPSLATWWCGERAALDAVLPALAQRVIKPTYGAPGTPSVLGRSLDPQALRDWTERLRCAPDDYTVQDYLPLSQMPTWDGQQIVPRSLLLRVFAMTDRGGGWAVLPGGLTRLAGATEEIASMQRGGSSADTWVLGSDSDPPPRGRPAGETATPSGGALTSRAAEHLFWTGRYAQRSQHALRWAQEALALTGPPPGAVTDRLRQALLTWVDSLSRSRGMVPADAPEANASSGGFQRQLVQGLVDRHGEAATSVAFNLQALQRAAAAVREHLTPAQGVCIQTLAQALPLASSGRGGGTLGAALGQAAADLDASGLLAPARAGDPPGRHFLALGAAIERLGFGAAALSTAAATGAARTEAGARALSRLLREAPWGDPPHAEGGHLAAVTQALRVSLQALGPATADLVAALPGLDTPAEVTVDPAGLWARCADLAWQLPEDLATRLFNHSDDAPRSVGA